MRGKKNLWILFPILMLLVSIPAQAAQKGSLAWTFQDPVKVAGVQIDAGRYMVSWLSHSPLGEATFKMKGKVIYQANFRVEERDTKARYDTCVIETDAGGNNVLKEIRLGGKKTALVFE